MMAMPQPIVALSDQRRPLEGSEAAMAGATVAMSAKEIERLSVIQQVLERRLTRVKAGERLGIGAKQVGRLCAVYQREGAAGLVSRKRGRVGNRKLPSDVEAQVVELASKFYQDCGPTLVREKLAERHGIKLSKETVRKVLSKAGLWLPKNDRIAKSHQPGGDGDSPDTPATV